MGFREQLNGAVLRIEARQKRVFVIATTIVQSELTVGGPITSAAGQPVKSGALRASFIPEFLDDHTWQTTTNLPYAESIENGVGAHGPLQLRSSVGGFHSLKTIVAGWRNVIEHAAAEARA